MRNIAKSAYKKPREAYEFLPAALEVLETPPLPFGRFIALIISACFLLAVIWAYWGEIDVVAISEGKTIPSGNIKIIQPLETGVVRHIYVKDGDSVKQGDVLIDLDPTESVVDLNVLKIDLAHYRLDEAIGYSLLQDNPEQAFVPPEGANELDIDTAKTQITEEHHKHISALKTINLENQKLESNIRSAIVEQKKLEAKLPIIEERLEGQKSLFKQGITQKPALQNLQQEFIETKASLETALESKNQSRAAIQANNSRIAELNASYRSEANQKYIQAKKQIATITQNINKALQRLNYLELRAPVDGVVQQLSVHTIGAVVNSAAPLLVIVPENTPLEIEALIFNKDIGFVEPNQIVEIKFEAFPFTRYGTIPGKIISVSNDAIVQEKLGAVYKAKVSLDQQQILIDGKSVNLTPGMTASVEVKTGKRRIIEFFFSPLLRYKDEAIRER